MLPGLRVLLVLLPYTEHSELTCIAMLGPHNERERELVVLFLLHFAGEENKACTTRSHLLKVSTG